MVWYGYYYAKLVGFFPSERPSLNADKRCTWSPLSARVIRPHGTWRKCTRRWTHTDRSHFTAQTEALGVSGRRTNAGGVFGPSSRAAPKMEHMVGVWPSSQWLPSKLRSVNYGPTSLKMTANAPPAGLHARCSRWPGVTRHNPHFVF